MMKTYISTNALPIKRVGKAKICILLLTIMGILIPSTINAKEVSKISVLTLEKKTEFKDDSYYAQICKNWNLTKADIKNYFKTAKPFTHSMEINSFNIFDCEVEGELLISGV